MKEVKQHVGCGCSAYWKSETGNKPGLRDKVHGMATKVSCLTVVDMERSLELKRPARVLVLPFGSFT